MRQRLSAPLCDVALYALLQLPHPISTRHPGPTAADGVRFRLSDLVVDRNSAGKGGALFFFAGASGLVERCVFLNNTSEQGDGGAVYQSGGTDSCSNSSSAVAHLRSCRISGNRAVRGGGIFLSLEAHMVLEHSTVERNAALANGGGAFVTLRRPLAMSSNSRPIRTAPIRSDEGA